MKKIEATIAPSQLDGIYDALSSEGIQGITVSEVRGVPLEKGHVAYYRGREYTVKFIPRMKIEVLVDDHQVPKIIAIIRMLARAEKQGDDRIFVIPIADAIRIRTGEHGIVAV